MKKFAGITAVLFDLDGTLVDSAPDLAGAADAMRLKRGLPSLDYANYRPLCGAGARGMLQVAFGMGPDHADYELLREEFFANYQACMLDNTHAFEGVPSLIETLQAQGLQWGVVTNKSERFALPLTAAMPLFGSAGAIVGGDTTRFSKPHPEPLFEAARRLGVAPELCLYVGDDERDIVAGKAAGMGTVAATYGYLGSASDVATWQADAQINSPSELLQLLSQA
jgi:phosphoglycolate phosphatase